MGVAIQGTGFFVPERVVTNDDLVATGLQTNDAWIVEHTGIHSRRMVADDQATSDLGVAAARMALEDAGVQPVQVGMIVCATSTPDYPLPSTAGLIQAHLGTAAGAFDLNSGCSGFAYALAVGAALQETMPNRHVLVVGADAYSRHLNWEDRTSAVFFGDGASAAVLAPAQQGWILASHFGSDGAGAEHIIIPAGGSKQPATAELVQSKATRFRMHGREVWNFARHAFPDSVRVVIERAGLTLDDVKLVIPHQANERLILACTDDMGLPRDRVMLNVDRYANTGSASIGIALAEAVRQGRLKRGDVAVLVGFGAGLAWGAVCLRWGGA